jgi:hypothetical protein
MNKKITFKNRITLRSLFFTGVAVIFSLTFYSCSDEFENNRTRKLLIDKNWKINTYIDYSQNQTTEFRNAVYDFREDNSLVKTYDDSDTVTTGWELSADSEYLTIGSNTFKITEISKRVLSLRYGDVEIFFVKQ